MSTEGKVARLRAALLKLELEIVEARKILRGEIPHG